LFIDASFADLAGKLGDSNPGLDVLVSVGGSLPGWRRYSDALATAGDPPPPSAGSEMLYSSGTTGRPKAVRRSLPTGNGSWAQAILELALVHRYGMNSSSVYLSPAPLYHAAGVNYTMAVNRVGAASIIMPKFDAETVLRLIETYRVTHAQFVPTMFVRMLKLPKAVRQKYDVSSLRCVIHAAAPCPIDVKYQMMDWFGPIIHEYYGGTEGFAGTMIGPEEWLAHPGSVGKPMTAVHVVGEDGAELPVGESGELYFEGGPDFEYFKDPEKTASVSNERGWRSLGDMGYVDEDGYLYLTDRSTFMIVSGGVNIYPQEAENLLVMHPKLVDAAVFGVPNDEFGEEVKAVVQPVDGVTPGPDLEVELIEYCRTHLASYKCPRTVEFDPELPRDPNGKLYKRRIRERYWQGRASRIV
jgi:acyl-CoA synthetase (AMP-forming)/AMP-acid ligase II